MLRIRVDGLHHIATIRRHGNCELPMRHQLKIAFHIDPGDGGTLMPARDAISFDKLARIIGTPRASLLLDVLSAEDFAADGHHRSRGGRHPASIISGAFCFSWAVTVLAGRLGLIQKDGQK
jgi:hypothetical protein